MSSPYQRRVAPKCSIPGCNKQAQTRQLCKSHGGGVRCRAPDCPKLVQSRGLCVAHGGGKRCAVDGCGKLAQYKGLCLGHGGGRRCRFPDCNKYVQVRGCCKAHSKLLDAVDTSTRPPSPTSDASIRLTSTTGMRDRGVCPAKLASYPRRTVRKTPADTIYLQNGGLGYELYFLADSSPHVDEGHSFAGVAAFGEATATTPLQYPPVELYRPACRQVYCQKRDPYL